MLLIISNKVPMQTHSFTKMVHFTRLIKAGGRLREFNLRKLKLPETPEY